MRSSRFGCPLASTLHTRPGRVASPANGPSGQARSLGAERHRPGILSTQEARCRRGSGACGGFPHLPFFLRKENPTREAASLIHIDKVFVLQVRHIAQRIVLLQRPLPAPGPGLLDLDRLPALHLLLPRHRLVHHHGALAQLLPALGVSAVEVHEVERDEPATRRQYQLGS